MYSPCLPLYRAIYYLHIRRGPKKLAQPKVRINEAIRASKVRLIDATGGNAGVVSIKDAIAQARKANLDLVEVTAKSNPPVVRIADYGKYQYEQNKLKKKWADQDKEKGKKQENTKHTQIKPGTSGDILEMRAKKIREWLDSGNRVQVDLFLFGRYKSMDVKFLKEKLASFIKTIPGEIRTADPIRKSPKGFSTILQASDDQK